MNDICIKTLPAFDTEQRADLGMHSLLNDLNVIMGQLYMLGILLADDENYLKAGIDHTKTFIQRLQDSEQAGNFLSILPAFKQTYLQSLEEGCSAVDKREADEEVSLCLSTVDRTFEKLMARGCQVFSIAGVPGEWANRPRQWADLFRGYSHDREPGVQMVKVRHYLEVARSVTVEIALEQVDNLGSFFQVWGAGLSQIFPYLLDRVEPDAKLKVTVNDTPEGRALEISGNGGIFTDRFLIDLESGAPMQPECHLANFFFGLRQFMIKGVAIVLGNQPGAAQLSIRLPAAG